ncbi:molybdopterin converting factor subunit 1 [Sphingobium phenoxybenzoativorans]|uniref:Molybdopterin synthase sulfur carrier subunit n=1 Tax=Sphingobium phenoxybenzoativorans TaxID=1592790 RepID=A0A975Q0K2_9SPHN|nr:molybdopterin converting factor subunit 1 [Sphingobium phenoxybenzoativorans]QUT04407.1 molybdopterin converting factor subunit 1 [Sphingobium phenoxybenzoativorans]
MAGLDILYFAWVRESIGKDGERIDHPGAMATVADLVMTLAARGGGYAEALGKPDKLRAAIDQRFVPMDTKLQGAKELALFPPVTGG